MDYIYILYLIPQMHMYIIDISYINCFAGWSVYQPARDASFKWKIWIDYGDPTTNYELHMWMIF